MYFLGIDGGGTKTQVIVADEAKRILGMAVVGPTNLRYVSQDTLIATLSQGIKSALADADLQEKVELTKTCFGIAGLDHPRYFSLLRGVLSGLHFTFGPDPIIVNDVVCALRRGTAARVGVAIVAGTGSHCYGKNLAGEEVYVGGLGPLLTDEGGGNYIGQRVLHAIAKSYDARSAKTLLEQLVCKHLGVLNVRDLVLKLDRPDYGVKEIAQLAIVCEEAAAQKDATAIAILEEAADELVLMVTTCATRLNLTQGFEIICSGGGFKRSEGPLRKRFENLIPQALKDVTLIYPTNEPAMGAILLALDSQGL